MLLAPCPHLTVQPATLALRLYYRLRGADLQTALNCDGSAADGSSGTDIVAALNRAVHGLQSAAFDVQTGRVDYAALARSPVYADYRQLTRQLRNVSLDALTQPAAKLAFWINLYNALIVDAVIAFKVRDSVQEVRAFFSRAAYMVGGQRFSADDIEHGILRANAGHPYLPGPQFRADDPRRALALDTLDPRIHFALVCAARSCPPVSAYDPEAIDRQLELAARNFVNGGEVTVDVAQRTVTLSRIFQWYSGDFGGGWLNRLGQGDFGPVLRTVGPYLEDKAARTALLHNPQDFRVRFKAYDWGLNLV